MSAVADIIAWPVIGISVLSVSAAVALVVKAMRIAFGMPSKHEAGSEFIPLALLPLYALAALASTVGAAAGFWLALRTASTAGSIVLYLVASVLAVFVVLSLLCVVLVWAAFSMMKGGRAPSGSREQDG